MLFSGHKNIQSESAYKSESLGHQSLMYDALGTLRSVRTIKIEGQYSPSVALALGSDIFISLEYNRDQLERLQKLW